MFSLSLSLARCKCQI
uniref:Uncharacterized protein n=1 Tax=Anguilla anguilla TaxID=7936 RepID=A0A0E9QTU5_ANGAN